MKHTPTDDLNERYAALDGKVAITRQDESALRPDVLLAFDYEHPDREIEVLIESQEFTALCPWTGLPDFGMLSVRYTPDRLCLELKSLKYYLLSFRSVGIVQEHAAARILTDLARVVSPRRMAVTLDYRVRGGLHTSVSAQYP
ncbi:MAG TPA: preQ(1) synthase [Myxococcota bacterium]|nr:preQ(1) synthase [Myxococcota bacterium]